LGVHHKEELTPLNNLHFFSAALIYIIRKACLSETQSGEMQEIGFNLYSAMLDTAIQSLKQGKEPDMQHPLGVAIEIKLHVPATAAG